MRIAFLLVTALYVTTGVAQTVTQAFNEPTINDVDKNYSLDTSAYTAGLPSAITGSNSVWDFTMLKGAFPVIFDSIVTPTAATGGSTFPTATYAQKRGGINAFFKSTASPAQTEWVGVYSPSLTVTFTNSAIIAKYPVSYGYSFTDPVTGTFKYNSTNGVCNGSITVTADGLGTLKLPGNVTFTNVLRLHSVEQLTMSTSFISVGSIYQTIFSYYAPGKKYPVLSLQYQNYQLLVGTPTITALAYGNFDYFTVEGLDHEIEASLNIFPDPFSDQLNIQVENEATPLRITLFSAEGKALTETSGSATLSTAMLPAGFYTVRLETPWGTVYRKLVKQ